MNFSDEIKEINNNLTNMYASYKKSVVDSIEKVTSAFFRDHPEANTLYWDQGTPTWNDGDPCTFSIYEIYATCLDFKTVSELAAHDIYDKYEELVGEIEEKDSSTKVFPEFGNRTLSEISEIDGNFDTKELYNYLRSNSVVFEDLYGNAVVYIGRDGNIHTVESYMD